MEELIGRAEELARLSRFAQEAAAGSGRLVLISGDAGSGKTSLVSTALKESALNAVFCGASALATAPLGPVSAAFRELRLEFPREVADRAALFQAIARQLCASTGGKPLGLVLDDLQWADHATLELLPTLAEASRGASLLVVAIYSADAIYAAHPLRAVRDALRRSRRAAELSLGALDEESVRRLAERCLGAPVDTTTARRLLIASSGLPFFVEALALAGAQGSGSRERTADAVLARVERLSAAARVVAETAAVIGTQIDLALLAGISGDEPGIEEFLASGLAFERSPGIAAFRPALVRETLYGAIPWTRRRNVHRAVAQALEAQGRDHEQAAEHWRAAGETLLARRALLHAAERSRTLHLHRDAARALYQALEGWIAGADDAARAAVLDQYGDVCQLAGTSADALKAWREVAECLPATLAAARALRKIANLHELNGDWARSLDARAQSQVAFSKAGEHAEAAIEGITAANRLRQGARHAAALEVLGGAAADADASGRKDLQVRVAALKGNLEVRLGQVGEIAAIRAALEAALGLDQPLLAGEIYQRLADAIERSGDYRRATAVNMEGISFCEQRKAPPGILACLACMSWILLRAGEWRHAEAASRRMAADFAGNPIGRGVGRGHLGMVHVLRGELRKAEPLLQEALALARRIEHALLETTTLWGLAMHAAASGNAVLAAERCRTIHARIRVHDERHALMPVLRWSASCFAEVRDAAGIRACAEFLNESAARFGDAEPLSALAHTLGEVAFLEGDPERAAEQFEHAVALLEDSQLPRERLESRLRAAAVCEALGRRDPAVAHAREAARQAERLGARLLADAAATQLRRLGEPLSGALGPRAGRRAAQAGLTARQLEILAAISRGQTDKEVARSLSLSPRTVETHVAKALAALDCRSRSEAVRKATELGLLAHP